MTNKGPTRVFKPAVVLLGKGRTIPLAVMRAAATGAGAGGMVRGAPGLKPKGGSASR